MFISICDVFEAFQSVLNFKTLRIGRKYFKCDFRLCALKYVSFYYKGIACIFGKRFSPLSNTLLSA